MATRKREKKLVGPIEIIFDPPAPTELYEKLVKAVVACTQAGHTVSVLAKPYQEKKPA